MISNAAQAAALLRDGQRLAEQALYLDCGGFCMAIRSNSPPFIEQLAVYFAHVTVTACEPDVVIETYDTDVLELDLAWKDWAREPGKSGRKDACYDLEDGRLVLKVRTGMVFLQSAAVRIAVGPCRRLDNQVINFINSQYMNRLQQQGWLICHAAGLDVGGYGIGFAGLSGGGKSTLMLALMDFPEVRYVTNDRLFVRRRDAGVEARGIPKLPRINPGTIVSNPALHGLLDAGRRAELLALPQQELWHLEEKHDVMIDAVYGPGRMQSGMPLNAFVVLNWSHSSADSTRLSVVDLARRQDLLPAIMKSPGPFYQFRDGGFYQDDMSPQAEDYLEALRGVTLLEAAGRVDIPLLTRELYTWVSSNR